MANEILASTTSSDQEKFLASKLLERTLLKLVCAGLCDKVEQPQGTGTTAYFVRYARMNVPMVTLTEAQVPSNSSFSLQTAQVTLDQWGDLITVSDVTQLTTKHPLLAQCIELLADNAQRVIDREIQLVWLAGTNVQYFDGTATARSTIAAGSKISDTVIHKAVVTMVNNGAPPRGGPSGGVQVEGAASTSSTINQAKSYVAVTAPNVIRDIMQAGTSLGTWAAVAMYANQKALYNAEVGTWLGVRWVETNFIPSFTLLGNSTAAVASGASFGAGTPTVTVSATGGALAAAAGGYAFKITRKDQTRGFEEAISIGHTTGATTGATSSVAFAFPATAGYVYNLYFDSTAGGGSTADSNMFMVQANIAAGATVTVTAVQTTGANPPANILATSGPSAIFPVYLHAESSCNWVSLQNLQTFITEDKPTIGGNELKQKRAVGYKFMGKAMIRAQVRILRIEVSSSY